MTEITKDTIIGDILDICPDAVPLFLEIGMHCLGCPASRGETVEQACMVHGTDADELVKKLNAFVKNNAVFIKKIICCCRACQKRFCDCRHWH